MKFELDPRCREFLRHGGKKNRRNVVRIINKVAVYAEVKSIDNLGRKHIVRFYKGHAHRSDGTLRNYFYAMQKLYRMLGRPGQPPKPEYTKKLK